MAVAEHGLRGRAIEVLRAWRTQVPGQERLRTRFVRHLEDHADGVYRHGVPDHLTASTLVLSHDGSRVLLTLHAKARRWFQLGGHLEPGDASLLEGAAREAREESGLNLELDPVPVHLDEHPVPFCGGRGDVRHLDVRFLAVAPPDAVHATSAESLDVAWWPVDDLPEPDPGLVELVHAAHARFASAERRETTRRT